MSRFLISKTKINFKNKKNSFISGQDINLAMKGLTSLDKFLCLAASAVSDREILQALNYKLKHAKNNSTGLHQKRTEGKHVFVILDTVGQIRSTKTVAAFKLFKNT